MLRSGENGGLWNNATREFTAGAVAGLCADAVMHPLDTVRAQVQVQMASKSTSALGMQEVFVVGKRLFARESLKGFFRGFASVALFTTPAHALYFGFYEYSKRNLPGEGTLQYAASGLVAEIAGATLWTPMEVIKQRMQVQRTGGVVGNRYNYTSLRHAFKTMYHEEGLRSFWRGYGICILMYGPMVSLYFATYENCRTAAGYLFGYDRSSLPFGLNLVSGGIAGAVGAALLCPMDMIRTRIQVQQDGEKYKGAFDLIRTALKEEGWRAFTRGIGARVALIAPCCALTIAFYEEAKRILP